MIEIQRLYETLTDDEAEQLSSLLSIKGNLKNCSDTSRLNVNTLKRAKHGLPITKENAKIIRRKLLKAAKSTAA